MRNVLCAAFPLLVSLALARDSVNEDQDQDAVADPDVRTEGLLSVAQSLNAGDERQHVLDELMDEQDLAQSVIEDGPAIEKEDAATLISNITDVDAVDVYHSSDAAAAAPTVPTDDAATAVVAKEGSQNTAAEAQLQRYQQDRLAAAELEGVQLRKMLTQADSYEKGLWAKMKTFKATAEKTLKKAEGQMQEIPKLKQRVTELSSLLEQEKKKEATQDKKLKDLKLKFAVAAQRTMRNNKALNLVRTHLKSLEAQNSELLQQIRNASGKAKSFHAQINATSHQHRLLLASLEDLSKQLRHNSTQLASAVKDADKIKQQLQQHMQAAEVKEKEVLAQQKESEKEVDALRETLEKEEKQLSAAKLQEAELKSKTANLGAKAKRGRREEKNKFHELKEAANDIHTLQQQVKMLQKRQLDGQSTSKKTQQAYAAAKTQLEHMQKEIKKLRGNAPWLEAKLKAEKAQAQSEVEKTRQAYEERDTAKAMLEQAKAKLQQLQEQYAGVVTVLGDADAKASTEGKSHALRGSQASEESDKPAVARPAIRTATEEAAAAAPGVAGAKKAKSGDESFDDASDLDQALAEDDDILSQTANLADDNLLSDA